MLIFLSSCLRCSFWGSSVVAIDASLLVGPSWWVSCSLSLLCDHRSSARSFGIYPVFSVWDSILLSSVGTSVSFRSCGFSMIDTISVAIPEQVCCVCPMKLCYFFSALFALKFNGWLCIFNHIIQWHFSTSFVVTYGAALTLQSRRFKFCFECATHYVCLGDSLSVLRQCHCCCCCCLFSLFRYLQFFIKFYLIF